MKKAIVFCLIMTLLCTVIVGSMAETWPTRDLDGTPVTIKTFPRDNDNSMRRQAYLGPQKNKYVGANSYRPRMVTSATAVLREGDYVLVDLLYHEHEKRFVYFSVDSLQEVPYSLSLETLELHPATMSRSVIALYGPGTDYEEVVIRVQSKYANWSWEQLEEKFSYDWEKIDKALRKNKYTVVVEAGRTVNALFEYNGWVFAEFDTDVGLARAWLPADAVQP